MTSRKLCIPAMRMLAIILIDVVSLNPISNALAIPAVPTWRLGTPWSTETATVMIGEDVLIADIADTSALRERGLGYRNGLEPGTGMLFVYNSPAVHTFWMKGMRFCLDIVWIEQGKLVGAAENVCPVEGAEDNDLPRYPSPEPVTYVLEVPAGWLQEHGHVAGDPVTITLPGD